MAVYRIFDSPVGPLTLAAEDGSICGLAFGRTAEQTGSAKEQALFDEAARQLAAYFSGTPTVFTLPLRFTGSDFQKKVWTALGQIPYGESCSYGALAAKIGCPKGARAVGMACNRNPIAILLPCHRVLGGDGRLTGFGGGLEIKRQLLRLEGIRWKE